MPVTTRSRNRSTTSTPTLKNPIPYSCIESTEFMIQAFAKTSGDLKAWAEGWKYNRSRQPHVYVTFSFGSGVTKIFNISTDDNLLTSVRGCTDFEFQGLLPIPGQGICVIHNNGGTTGVYSMHFGAIISGGGNSRSAKVTNISEPRDEDAHGQLIEFDKVNHTIQIKSVDEFRESAFGKKKSFIVGLVHLKKMLPPNFNSRSNKRKAEHTDSQPTRRARTT